MMYSHCARVVVLSSFPRLLVVDGGRWKWESLDRFSSFFALKLPHIRTILKLIFAQDCLVLMVTSHTFGFATLRGELKRTQECLDSQLIYSSDSQEFKLSTTNRLRRLVTIISHFCSHHHEHSRGMTMTGSLLQAAALVKDQSQAGEDWEARSRKWHFNCKSSHKLLFTRSNSFN